MNRPVIAVAALALALSMTPGLSPAFPLTAVAQGPGTAGRQTPPEGLSVLGSGSISTRPDHLEIEAEVSAASELSADAIVKFRDAKKRLREALDALKMTDLTVEERGLLVNEKGQQSSPYFFDGMPNRRSKAEVQLARKLVVSRGKIRELGEDALLQLVAKLLDVTQDAGGKVGGSEFNPYSYRYNTNSAGLVRFVLSDFEKIEEEAYARAFANAEAKAKRLAKLSGMPLGPVLGVQVLSSPGESQAPSESQSAFEIIYGIPQAGGGDANQAKRRIVSQRFEEIPVRVELLVRFGLGASSTAVGGPEGGAR